MSQVSHGLYFHLTDMGLILRGNEWKFLKKFRDVDRDLKTARCSRVGWGRCGYRAVLWGIST